ncbi:flagellar basal body P-ring formation chaperone FlgA [Parashewanella tropica]|uniref:flagellar basal body P-ring formation chaperone FlgA n=1 Tax=Parashewanella tropica TaxID=2547970 RepID=UPI0014797BE8|nr:flagellar basal body P-ring formation chaperone FlgA [Parashewanella tropica]
MRFSIALDFSIFFALLLPFSVSAQPYTPDLGSIESLAVETVRSKIQVPSDAELTIKAQGLDNRFKLPSCVAPMQAKISNNRVKALTTVKLSCKQANQALWQSFVSVKVSIYYRVAVANRILSTGQVITADDVIMKSIDERRLRGAMFDQLNALVGTRLKRRIGKGNVIYQQNVCYVCKGDIVSIFAKSANLQIKTVGMALNDGNPNDKIRVRNSKSNKIIEVNVIGVGEVEVKM